MLQKCHYGTVYIQLFCGVIYIHCTFYEVTYKLALYGVALCETCFACLKFPCFCYIVEDNSAQQQVTIYVWVYLAYFFCHSDYTHSVVQQSSHHCVMQSQCGRVGNQLVLFVGQYFGYYLFQFFVLESVHSLHNHSIELFAAYVGGLNQICEIVVVTFAGRSYLGDSELVLAVILFYRASNFYYHILLKHSCRCIVPQLCRHLSSLVGYYKVEKIISVFCFLFFALLQHDKALTHSVGQL